MAAEMRELYPGSGTTMALEGTYLGLDLFRRGSPAEPFVYANFVASLDGRIAVAREAGAEPGVPEELPNPHDFRLFQELQAHADCQVAHGSYLRALASGELGDILQVGVSEAARDIGQWRRDRGLAAQPGVAVVSRTLDFPLPPSVLEQGQPVHILTGKEAPPERIRQWRERGFEVHLAGAGAAVEGRSLIRILGELGYSRIHLLAGPKLLTTALREGVLSRLFVTTTHQILGGDAFHTFATGPLLGEAGRFRLRSLYYDPTEPRGTGQWFAAFDART